MASRPEILAPAGDLPALSAALAAGADAVYFGLDDGFNARARAANFSSTNLAPIVEQIHRAGAHAYVTMNTLVFEQELPVVEQLLARVAAAGVDAVIVQDPAVALLARAICPELHVHGSTQMTASSPEAAELLRTLGLDRVVVPRELSVDDIAVYAAGTTLPLEVFIHGALCVSWSGQCLTSESWGGRSANRGQCAQSCRLPYQLVVDGKVQDLGDVAYLLSPQDLVGLAAVPALAELGVASLKIEGRLKGPQYVAAAVTAYRKRVHAPDDVLDETDLAALAQVYSRGVSAGFLAGVDHQRLVEGRFPRHRGVPLGIVTSVRGEHVTVDASADMRPWTGALAADAATREAGPDPRPAQIPELPTVAAAPRAGMGVVFDHGTPEAPEQGGPIFAVEAALPDGYRLRFGTPGPDLTKVAVGDRVWISSDPALIRAGDRAAERGTEPLGRVPVDLVVTGSAGNPLVVRATSVRGSYVAQSRSSLAQATGTGLGESVLADKLGALGGTSFHLRALDLSGLPAGLHVPVGELKELRRQLTVSLEAAQVAVHRSVATISMQPAVRAALPDVTACPETAPLVVPLCRTDAQLDAVLAAGATEVELDWMELVGLGRATERARAAGARVVLATMRVQKPGETKIDAHLAKLSPDGILVRSWGSLAYFASLPARPILHGDFSLNITNSITAQFVLGQGLATATCAHDLDEVQLRALLAATPRGRLAVTVHHHMATFHTEHCVYAHQLSGGADFRTCGRPCEKHQIGLTDRVGMTHPVVVDVGCRNTVFNAQAQSAGSLVPELVAAGVIRLRVELVRESGAEAASVFAAYRELAVGSITSEALVKRLRTHEQFGVTRGTMRTLPMLA